MLTPRGGKRKPDKFPNAAQAQRKRALEVGVDTVVIQPPNEAMCLPLVIVPFRCGDMGHPRYSARHILRHLYSGRILWPYIDGRVGYQIVG